MEPSTNQENLGSVTSRDAWNKPLSPSREQSRQSPSHSSYSNLNGNIINSLLCRFLNSLNAKRVVSHQGYHIFTLQPGAYTKTLESLCQSDTEVWGYVLDKLR